MGVSVFIQRRSIRGAAEKDFETSSADTNCCQSHYLRSCYQSFPTCSMNTLCTTFPSIPHGFSPSALFGRELTGTIEKSAAKGTMKEVDRCCCCFVRSVRATTTWWHNASPLHRDLSQWRHYVSREVLKRRAAAPPCARREVCLIT